GNCGYVEAAFGHRKVPDQSRPRGIGTNTRKNERPFMNCQHCEERMSDYLEGALSANGRDAFDLHLQSCSGCSELLAGMREVLAWGRRFPGHEPPSWLRARIVANTPRRARESWTDTVGALWKWIVDPRAAMGLFTATLVLGWLGSLAGVSP